MKNYYEILQVNKTADKEIIQKVYKILTKKYHPDLQQNDEDREYAEKAMAKINEAYEILSDDEKRKQYDYELEQDEQRKLEKEIRKYIDRMNSYSEINTRSQIQNNSVQHNTQVNTGYNQSYNNTNYTPGYSRYVSYGSSRKSQKKRKKIVAAIMDLVISFCILAGILFILYFARQFLSFISFS